MKVYEQLNKARKEFHCIQLKKSGKNAFAEYSYFELSDFLLPAMDIFDKHLLCGVVSFGETLAQITITSIDDHSQIVITSPMGSAKLKACHEVQNIGAVETYQRRYLWMAALEIMEHDALDSSEGAEVAKVLLPSITAMHKALETEDFAMMRETWDELSKDEQEQVWTEFKTKEKTAIKALLHKAATGG